jgi:hypothetical protein
MSVFQLHPDEVHCYLLAAGLLAATGQERARWSALRRPPRQAHDRQVLIGKAISAKMLPMLLDYIVEDVDDEWREFQRLGQAFASTQRLLLKDLSSITEQIERAGIPVMVIKGADLALRCYRSELPRMMCDADLLVRPHDLSRVSEILAAAGYVQGVIDDGLLTIVPLRDDEKQSILDHCMRSNYEIPAFRRFRTLPELSPNASLIERYLQRYFNVVGNEVHYVQEYDIHFNLARALEQEDVWDSPATVQLPSGRVSAALCPTVMLGCLSFKLYMETILQNSKSGLRQFVDVLALIHRLHSKIDWGKLSRLAKKYRSEPPFFYIFSHVNEFLGPVVPERILSGFDPLRNELDRENDLGDLMAKLMGQTPMFRVL